MSRLKIRASLAITLLSTAACSQPAATVDMKGQYSFGRNHYNDGYASNGTNAPISFVPQTIEITPMPAAAPASVQTVSSNDLPPPVASKPVVLKQVAAKPAETKTVAQNRWTGKPHFAETMTVEEKPVAEAEIAKPVVKPAAKPVTVAKAAAPAPAPVKTAAVAQTQQGFIWPVNGKKIISGFGPKHGGKVNDGINIAADNGEPVWAAADGEVVYVGNELQGYGNMVLVKHANGKTTSYAHMGSTTVDKYDRVKQGDIIGYVGSTGNVKSPQLHFAIRNGKEPVDPRKYLNSSVAGL